jgi:O-antigen/teichoic acid export membrane protein
MGPAKAGQHDRDEQRRSLDRSLLSGVAWSGVSKWAAQAVTWLSTLLVARLLTPADYGIVGLAWLYLGLVAMTTEFGIGSAVVTLRSLSRQQIQQLNSLAAALGFLACGLSLALALPLAAFFGEPRLAAVVAVLSAGPIVSGFKVVPEALLRKELRFRRVAAYEGAQAVASALSTLGLAATGCGYWALVFGNLLGAATQALLVVRSRPEAFAWPRRERIAPAVSFSRDVLGSQLAWYAYDNADFLVAGKVLGTDPLGAYNLAWTFASMPLDKLVSLVGRVTPAVLSAVQTETAELRRYVLRITEAISLVVFPMGVGLALVADDFVRSLLGDKWLPAVEPLRILAAYTCVRALQPLWSQVLTALGDTAFMVRVSALGAILLPLGFLAGSHWGLAGIACTWLVLHPPVVVVPVFARLRKRISLPFAEYGRTLRLPAVATLVMWGAVELTRAAAAAAGPLQRLAIAVAAGAAAYGVVVAALGRQRLRSVFRALTTAFLDRG